MPDVVNLDSVPIHPRVTIDLVVMVSKEVFELGDGIEQAAKDREG